MVTLWLFYIATVPVESLTRSHMSICCSLVLYNKK